MESIFDIFFEHKIETLRRCGLKTRQNRTDVIDHLTAVVSGYAEGESELLFCRLASDANVLIPQPTLFLLSICESQGQNVSPNESCQLAIAAAINYHRAQKKENATVSYPLNRSGSFIPFLYHTTH